MKTFGLGTAAALASVERYARFTGAMRHVYGTMERTLDSATSPATAPLWEEFGPSLRREASLSLDLADVAAPDKLDALYPPTAAVQGYMDAVILAGAKDEMDGGGRLIGHLYCRYFADLFGGQFLAAPTRFALAPAVLEGTPRHYDFGEFGANRKESIERLYLAFNEAGDLLGSDAARQIVVDETRLAFALNVDVYTEEGGLWSGAAQGVANMASGYVRSKLQRPRSSAA